MLQAAEICWSVHGSPLLDNFVGLPHCSETSNCSNSQFSLLDAVEEHTNTEGKAYRVVACAELFLAS